MLRPEGEARLRRIEGRLTLGRIPQTPSLRRILTNQKAILEEKEVMREIEIPLEIPEEIGIGAAEGLGPVAISWTAWGRQGRGAAVVTGKITEAVWIDETIVVLGIERVEMEGMDETTEEEVNAIVTHFVIIEGQPVLAGHRTCMPC